MSGHDAELRDRIAGQLDELLSGPLASNGERATALLARHLSRGAPTPARRRFWDEIEDRYLVRQSSVARDGRAALLTAGAPGAGKSTAVQRLGLVDEGWRHLDADIVKDYLIQDLIVAGDVGDVLARRLADGRTVMPRELAGLVHTESVIVLDRIRSHCLDRGENVVIEGTLVWEPAGRQVVDELVHHGYRDVSVVDVEVRREVARAQAVARWWTGRCDSSSDLGGRWVPLAVIDRAYPDAQSRSVCAANARALFDSDLVRAVPLARLTIVDNTGSAPVTETHERRSGVLQPPQAPQPLPLDSDVQMPPLARQSLPRNTIPARPPAPPAEVPRPASQQ